MAVSVKVSGGDRWKEALSPYVTQSKTRVDVGVLQGATYSGETAPAGTLVAPIAAAHEFGAVKKDGTVIPQRSFLRATVIRNGKEWSNAALRYLQSNPGKIRGAFTLIGELASKDVQEAISFGIDPPLKEATIARKRRRGKEEPDTPLIDTGTLQESISYQVNV